MYLHYDTCSKLTKKSLLYLNEKDGHNILQLFSPTAWTWGGFVVYFDQQNVAEWNCASSGA